MGILVVLLAFIHVLNAVEFGTEGKNPEGPLGVRLDWDLATSTIGPRDGDHRWVFSSRLKFKRDVSQITDGQLVRMT